VSVGIRELETDVLILGGGLAALRAAIAAISAGAQVAVMTKGTAGRAGSSAITSAGFSVAIGQADPTDSPESHFADTIRGGGVNRRRLVEVFCEEAPARFWEMVRWGVQFEQDAATGRILQHPSGDHSHPRTAVCVQRKGIGMTLPLRDAAAGVMFLDRIIALDLMRDENGVSGVVALDQQTLELVTVRARATILATGGIGQLYPVTSNPNDVTGDGLALAYRAGARLVDMEFVQFYPWRLISYVTGRMPVQPSSFVAGAVLRNADGERFMPRYDPERRDATTRDIAARAIYTEILEGRGLHGGVRLDLAQAPLEEFVRLNPRVGRYFADHGLDLATAELILAPEAHFLMGGVVIDENGRTSLPGLLAAGEVSGGSDGGNRLDSNAIPAGQVFGRRAGIAAAADAAARGQAGLGPDAVSRWARRLGRRALGGPARGTPGSSSGGTAGGIDRKDIKRRINDLMLRAAGIRRDGARLAEGVHEAGALSADYLAAAAEPRDALAAIELENMALVASIVVRAAQFRTESRAAHYRDDYPDRDDASWFANVYVDQDADGQIAMTKEKIT
jgi:fumarate reductase (CoM/CoB) subunit A